MDADIYTFLAITYASPSNPLPDARSRKGAGWTSCHFSYWQCWNWPTKTGGSASAGLKFFGALGWIELWGPSSLPSLPSHPTPTGGGEFPWKGPYLLQFWRYRGKSGKNFIPTYRDKPDNGQLLASIYFELTQQPCAMQLTTILWRSSSGASINPIGRRTCAPIWDLH